MCAISRTLSYESYEKVYFGRHVTLRRFGMAWAEDVLLWQINAQFFDTRSCFSKSVGAAQLNWNTGNTENTIKRIHPTPF